MDLIDTLWNVKVKIIPLATLTRIDLIDTLWNVKGGLFDFGIGSPWI